MLHNILVKWTDQVTDKPAIARLVAQTFEGSAEIPGVHGVAVRPNIIDRPNRYDLLIQLDMDEKALTTWDESDIHKRWKANFGGLVEKKAIFDCE